MIKNKFCQFSKQTLKLKLINKFFYNNTKKIPYLKKIILTYNQKTPEFITTVTELLALEIISGQKSFKLKNKNPNLNLKFKKNQPIGAQLVLRKNNKDFFASKIIDKIFTQNKFFFLKNYNYNSVSFKSFNNLSFSELENNFSVFKKLNSLNIVYVTNTLILKETQLILKFYKVPL